MPRKMTQKRFRELVAMLELSSQEKAADALGVGARTFVRYWNGKSPVPPYLRRLLLCMALRDVNAAMMGGEW